MNMEEIITFSSRGQGGVGSKIGRVTKLVKPFWPIQKEANTDSISIKHSRYSERRIEAGMEAIIENLMKEPEGTWVSRVTLKQRSRSSVGDTGLLNFSLRCVENRRVGDGMIVRRSIHPVSQVMAYRLERVSSTSADPPLICEERRVPDPNPPRKESDANVGENRKEGGEKPRPVRRRKELVLEERALSKEEKEEVEFEEGLSTLFAMDGEIRPLPAMVDGQAVNLLSLYQHVACNGGYQDVSKRREWNVIAAQMGLKLEAGPCLKLLHAKYLLGLEALLGDLSPPSQAPKVAQVPPQGPQRTRSSSTCTSERVPKGSERLLEEGGDNQRRLEGGFEGERQSRRENEIRTTLPSLRAVSEGSLGQHAESKQCTETDATSSACSLKVEEDSGGFEGGLAGFQEGREKDSSGFNEGLERAEEGVEGVKGGALQEMEVSVPEEFEGFPQGFKGDEGVVVRAKEEVLGAGLREGLSGSGRGDASKGEGGSIDLGPETSIEGSLLTDALLSTRSFGGKQSLTESELFGVSLTEPPAVRKSGIYVSGSVSEVSGTADLAGARGGGCAEPPTVPTGRGPVPTDRDKDGGANLLDDDFVQPVGHPDCRPCASEGGPVNCPEDEGSFRGFGGLRALTVSLQGLDGLGPQDASELEHWLGENRRKETGLSGGEPETAKPKTLSPQRLKLILNPSPRKMHLSPRMMHPSPRNLTLSPSKWMQSLSGQKRKAGLLSETQVGGFGEGGLGEALETPEAKRQREEGTGHPLMRPRRYRSLTAFADPVNPQLTATLTALREQLRRHRESTAWQGGLAVRLRAGAEEGRRTRKKQAEEELEYLQPRIGPRYQANVPDWIPPGFAKPSLQPAATGRKLSGSLAMGPDDDVLTSEATWISRPVWRPLEEPAPTSDPVAKPGFVVDPWLNRPGLRQTSSQTDGAAVRKQLVADARTALEAAVGVAGGDLGLAEMGERVAKRWARGEEQRFVATAASIKRGKDVSDEFFGGGFFQAIQDALPERSLAELVSYYYNVYKVRCKRGLGRAKGVGKMGTEGGTAPLVSAKSDRDQTLNAGLRD